MILLVDEYLANLLGHGEFAQGFALTNPLAIVSDRLIFIVQIEPKHLSCVFRSPDRLGSYVGILPR